MCYIILNPCVTKGSGSMLQLRDIYAYGQTNMERVGYNFPSQLAGKKNNLVFFFFLFHCCWVEQHSTKKQAEFIYYLFSVNKSVRLLYRMSQWGLHSWYGNGRFAANRRYASKEKERGGGSHVWIQTALFAGHINVFAFTFFASPKDLRLSSTRVSPPLRIVPRFDPYANSLFTPFCNSKWDTLCPAREHAAARRLYLSTDVS